MKHVEVIRRDSPRHRPAAELELRASGQSTAVAMPDRHASQRELADAIHGSPRARDQGRMTRAMSGKSAQLQIVLEPRKAVRPTPMKEEVVDKGVEKPDVLIPAQDLEDDDASALAELLALDGPSPEAEAAQKEEDELRKELEPYENEPLTLEQAAEQLTIDLDQLFFDLAFSESTSKGLEASVLAIEEANSNYSVEELESYEAKLAEIEEANAALAHPLNPQVPMLGPKPKALAAGLADEDALLNALAAEEDNEEVGPADFGSLQFLEENVAAMEDFARQLAALRQEQIVVRARIRELQAELRLLCGRDADVVDDFNKEKRAKKGGKLAMTAAKYLVPVTAAPIALAETVLAAIATAKTIRHILNLRKIRERTQNADVQALISYAIRQKSQKAGKMGLKTLGAGIGPTVYGAAKAGYKMLRHTKGVERERQAKALFAAAKAPDKDARDAVEELVGTDKVDQVLDAEEGWKIVFNKLASN